MTLFFCPRGVSGPDLGLDDYTLLDIDLRDDHV